MRTEFKSNLHALMNLIRPEDRVKASGIILKLTEEVLQKFKEELLQDRPWTLN